MQEIGELLASVRERYATASTYSDSGRMAVAGGWLDGESAVFETRRPDVIVRGARQVGVVRAILERLGRHDIPIGSRDTSSATSVDRAAFLEILLATA